MNFLELARQYQDQMIDDLKQVVRIPSLLDEDQTSEHAPFGPAVREALDWMLEKGKTDGFDVLDVDGYAGVVSYGEGSESIGILGHLDIVPVGEGWSVDPFEAVVKDGYLIGRGTGDDKGPTIAAYTAMKILKDLDLKPKKKIMLIAGCDEESGMRCMKYYQEHGEVPQMGFVPDASFPLIYGEKGILNVRLKGEKSSIIDSFVCGERSNIVLGKATVIVNGLIKPSKLDFFAKTHRLKATCEQVDTKAVYVFEGVFSHASTPQHGLNAGVYALNFIAAAYKDELAHQLSQLLYDYHGRGLNIYMDGSHMGNLTMNLGIVNISNSKVDCIIDIRYPNDVNLDFCLQGIQDRITECAPWLEYEVVIHKEPLFVDPNSELVKTLHQVYIDATQDNFTPLLTMGGGTYARTLPNFVAYGMHFPLRPNPDFIGGAHQKDEGIEIEGMVLATAIYAEAIYRLAYEGS